MELPPNSGSGVYAIVNTQNGKLYVGSTNCFRKRLRGHLKKLRAGTHHSAHLQRAWNAWGEGSFEFRILLECDEIRCRFWEQIFMDEMRSYDRVYGYNASSKATCGPGRPKGWHHSPEDRARISAQLKGQKLTAECRAKISAAGKGRKQSAEHAAKRMASWKANGRLVSDETRAKQSAAHKGKVLSPEQRAKLSKAGKGRKQSAEHVARRTAARKDTLATVGQKPRSEESRARQSAAQMGRKHSEETLAKMSESHKGNKNTTGHKQSPEHLARRVAAYKAAVARRKLTSESG